MRLPFVRAFAAGRVVAVLGSQVLHTAAGWELYERTGDELALGLVGLVEIIPVLVLMLPAGNICDRFARRDVSIVAHAIFASAALGLFAASTLGWSNVAMYAMLALVGAARAFAAPSTGTILPQLLSPAQFANANAWTSTAFQLAAAIGPAVGGFMIEGTGAAPIAYGFAAGAQVLYVALLVAWVPRVPAAATHTKRTFAHLTAGFSFIRRERALFAAILVDMLAVLFAGAVALVPVFARDILEGGPTALGWLRAAPAIGALLMALALTRRRPWERPGRVMLWSVVGFAIATIGFGLSRELGLSLAFLAIAGAFDEVSVVIRQTLEQSLTPDALRGRVSSVNAVFVGCSNELGGFESGTSAKLTSPTASVVGGGLIALVAVAWVWRRFPALVRLGPLHELRAK